MNLIIAKNKIDRNQLIELPAPNHTETHRPIKFSNLVERTEKTLNRHGYAIESEEFATSRKDQAFFGAFALRNLKADRNEIFKDDRRAFFGLQASYNKLLANRAAMGNHLMVCENLQINSEVVLSRKNTKNVDCELDAMLDNIVSKIATDQINSTARFDAYKRTEINNAAASNLVYELAEIDAIPQRSVFNVINEFRNQRHAEFKGRHLWNLHNSITENLKGSDLTKIGNRTMKAQARFDSIADFKALDFNTEKESEIVLAS